MSEWETFCDESYYHLWRVRRKSDRNFNDGFHVQDGKEAAALAELLNGLERECDEARRGIRLMAQNAELWKERADEAREALEYIAHSGMTARHIADYAIEFLEKRTK